MAAGRLQVTVAEIQRESPVVKRFTLAPTDRRPLPRFGGGSHITTYVRTRGQVIERHYSLINDAKADGCYQIAIRRSEHSRGGSVYWNDHVKVGDQLEISYPKNHFPLSSAARRHLFFATGIGVTPFLAMMLDLQNQGKPFELHYAATSRDLCAFYADLVQRYPGRAHFYFSREENRMSPDIMRNQPIGTHVYLCGSGRMMKEYVSAATLCGYPEASIHRELFAPVESGPMHAFQVELRKSGRILDVREGESLLDVLLDNGIEVAHACRAGGCGSCRIPVIRGEVDHRDWYLSDQERRKQNVIVACTSRARQGPLVLDL